MSIIAYGLIDIAKTDKCLEFFEKNNLLKDVFYATNRTSLLIDKVSNKIIFVDHAPIDRNHLIDAVKATKSYDYLFLFDDILIPKMIEVFEKYIEKMQLFDLGMIFYGYGKGCNRALSVKANPGVVLQIDPGVTLQTSRFICDSFIGLDLSKVEPFDERFKLTYFREYVARLATKKLIPFNGFFIDINDSWAYFSETPPKVSKDEATKNTQLYKQEQTVMQNENIQNNIDNRIDELVKFVYKIYTEQKGWKMEENTIEVLPIHTPEGESAP